MRKLIVVLIVLGAGYWLQHSRTDLSPSAARPASSADARDLNAADAIAHAYEHQLSNVQVEGEGEVIKVLKDDNEGSRHQRFLLRLQSDQTVLIAHNIDLASRVEALRAGDRVRFRGEYEWNNKGGVIHWTHRDPNGRHADGWLEHNGHRYH